MNESIEVIDYGQFLKRIMERKYTDVAKQFKLTNNQVAIILYLRNSQKDTATDIISDLFFSKSHVSMSIKTLVVRGYIIKENDTDDMKIVHLKLTSKAGKIIEELEERKESIEEIVFMNFTKEEILNTKAMIKKMIENVNNSNILN